MSIKARVISRLTNKPMCYFSSQETVDGYNRQMGGKMIKKCDDISFWHDTYCKKHHEEGWGNCTCCNWRLG